jgi:23S rRNA (uracil1939-C5)-methyltransferase
MSQPCPHLAECGGCDWPHVEAAEGAPLKAEVAAEAARQFPALSERLRSAPVQPSPPGYRLRARLHWDPESGRLGFYARRSWRTTDIPACRILSPRLMGCRHLLAAALQQCCPERVDVEWLEDLEGVRAVLALRPERRGPKAVDGGWLPQPSVMASVIDGAHRLTISGQHQPGWGAASVTMALPIELEVPVGAFFQGNRHLARWLFDRVAGLVGGDPAVTWDLHAGVGFLAAAAATASRRELHLVETYRPAGHAARSNLPGAEVAVGLTAEDVLGRRRRLPSQALVLTDPPRAGMSVTLRGILGRWRPERVLMLACDPATWARDTADLLKSSYRLSHLELVDLFPFTHHVEIVALLERT